MNNRDETEARFKNAFDTSPAPTIDPHALQTKMNAPAHGFSARRTALLVLACFVFLGAATTTQICARRAGFDNGFVWLAYLIGEDTARELQLLSIPRFDMNDFDDKYRVGTTITDDGIFIELIAVGVDGDYIDLYMLLEDTTGTHNWCDLTWRGQLLVDHHIRFTDPELKGELSYFIFGRYVNLGRPTDFAVIGRNDEDAQVLLHSRLQRPSLRYGVEVGDADPRALTISISEIGFVRESEELHFNANITRLLRTPSPALRNNSNYTLTPHTHDEVIRSRGYTIHISAIAHINNRLHIQLYRGENVPYIIPVLTGRDGRRIEDTHIERSFFDTFENGQFITNTEFEDEYGNVIEPSIPRYNEFTFFVEESELEYLRLYGAAIDYSILMVNWTMDFHLVGGDDLPTPRSTPSLEDLIEDLEDLIGPSILELYADPAARRYLISPSAPWRGVSFTFYPGGGRETLIFICANGETFLYEDLYRLPPLLREYLIYRVIFEEILEEITQLISAAHR